MVIYDSGQSLSRSFLDNLKIGNQFIGCWDTNVKPLRVKVWFRASVPFDQQWREPFFLAVPRWIAFNFHELYNNKCANFYHLHIWIESVNLDVADDVEVDSWCWDNFFLSIDNNCDMMVIDDNNNQFWAWRSKNSLHIKSLSSYAVNTHRQLWTSKIFQKYSKKCAE